MEVDRPVINETTALGAAFLAGLAVGFWKDESELEKCRKTDIIFRPKIESERRVELLNGWREAVRKVIYEG
jgi:glycerol kinase